MRIFGRHRRDSAELIPLRAEGARAAPCAADEPTTWLAWPTLSAGGGGMIKSAGAYYNSQNIQQAIARFGSLAMARLVIETDGEYAGAVRVTVGGLQVGSIPHAQAPAFREAIELLNRAGQQATCRAQLEAEPAEDRTYVDVFLWVGPAPRGEEEPFLPPGLGARIELSDGEPERLDESLHSKAKNKRAVRGGLLRPRGDGWAVELEGRPIGTLASVSYARLNETLAAGAPLSCRVRILREQGKPLRVNADFPW